MLNDINKSIPKFDDNDKTRMYNNLHDKLNEKKNKPILKRNILILLPILTLSIIITACIIIINAFNQNTNNSNMTNYDYFCSNEDNIIGMAAFRLFDEQSSNNSNRNNKISIFVDNYPIDENDNENTTTIITGLTDDDNQKTLKSPSSVSYPYDYIRISNALKFTVNVPKIEDYVANQIIDINCGLGELEVVIAYFTTYVDEDGKISPHITEQLLCIRGQNGYYTLLSSSINFDVNDLFSIENYTSYKKITKDAVEKKFGSPVLEITLKKEDDNRYIYFREGFKKDNKYNKDFAFKISDTVEKVSSEILYSVLDLSELPTKTIIVKVKSINFTSNIIQVESDNDVECIYIYTSITVHDYSDFYKINIGDYIEINYNDLFNGYRPKCVVANEFKLVEKT